MSEAKAVGMRVRRGVPVGRPGVGGEGVGRGPADGGRRGAEGGPDCSGVYVISVAARLLEMHPQTLRKYDREGLVRPTRSDGMLRLYSDDDLDRLRAIRRLVDGLGMNLAGARFALEVVSGLRDVLDALEEEGGQVGRGSVRRAVARLRGVLESAGWE